MGLSCRYYGIEARQGGKPHKYKGIQAAYINLPRGRTGGTGAGIRCLHAPRRSSAGRGWAACGSPEILCVALELQRARLTEISLDFVQLPAGFGRTLAF